MRVCLHLGLFWMFLLTSTTAGQSQDFTYTTNNGTITITTYTGTNSEVTIPSTISDLPVTSIGFGAFSHRSGLISITIPSSITTIGDGAFANCGLNNVIIPDSVLSIGVEAFLGCANLTNIAVPGSVTSIGSGAFDNCNSMTSITVDALNSGYSSVDGVLFDKTRSTLIKCPGGKTGTYTVPNGVTALAGAAFVFCFNVTDVTIPDSVTNMGFRAFYYCTRLGSVTIGTNVTRIVESTFAGCGLTNIAIPSNVTGIDKGAFQSCPNLRSVTMPNGLKKIGAKAFDGCTSLANVTIPKNVASIEDYAFSACSNLTAFTVDLQSSVYSSLNGVLFDKGQTTLIMYPPGRAGDYSIQNGVTTIGTNAFGGCTSLTSLMIPSTVTNIGPGAFASCSRLATIAVEALNPSYSSVEGVLFSKTGTMLIQYPAGKVGTYRVPSVTSVGDEAFAGCGLASLTIPSSVTNIGVLAFDNSLSLGGVFFEGNAPTFDLKVNGPGSPLTPFSGDKATIYYLPGTTGWSTNFAGLPTAPWNPQLQSEGIRFGVRSNQFGFNITWAGGAVIVVETSSNLANANWSAQATDTLTNGSFNFSDPLWTNSPQRFYRIRSL